MLNRIRKIVQIKISRINAVEDVYKRQLLHLCLGTTKTMTLTKTTPKKNGMVDRSRGYVPPFCTSCAVSYTHLLRAERYLLASESLADMASALLKLMSLPPDGNRPFSDYVRHMIGPARTLATIQRQLSWVLTPTARKELDRISSAVHLFLEERSDPVSYTHLRSTWRLYCI